MIKLRKLQKKHFVHNKEVVKGQSNSDNSSEKGIGSRMQTGNGKIDHNILSSCCKASRSAHANNKTNRVLHKQLGSKCKKFKLEPRKPKPKECQGKFSNVRNQNQNYETRGKNSDYFCPLNMKSSDVNSCQSKTDEVSVSPNEVLADELSIDVEDSIMIDNSTGAKTDDIDVIRFKANKITSPSNIINDDCKKNKIFQGEHKSLPSSVTVSGELEITNTTEADVHDNGTSEFQQDPQHDKSGG